MCICVCLSALLCCCRFVSVLFSVYVCVCRLVSVPLSLCLSPFLYLFCLTSVSVSTLLVLVSERVCKFVCVSVSVYAAYLGECFAPLLAESSAGCLRWCEALSLIFSLWGQ